MEVESIGQAGNSLNFSYASSAMNIKPDEAQIEKYDHLPLGVTLKWYDSGAVQIAALFTVIALALFYFHHWIWGSAIGLLALFIGYSATLVNLVTLYKKEAYESGLLVPGVITSLSPLQIMSFGELRNSLEVPTHYGVRKFTVNSLPHHQLVLGEKVPCVALFSGNRKSSYWEDFRPRPVCWGFENPAAVSGAIKALSEQDEATDEQGNWETLKLIAQKYADIATDTMVIIDNDLAIVQS